MSVPVAWDSFSVAQLGAKEPTIRCVLCVFRVSFLIIWNSPGFCWICRRVEVTFFHTWAVVLFFFSFETRGKQVFWWSTPIFWMKIVAPNRYPGWKSHPPPGDLKFHLISFVWLEKLEIWVAGSLEYRRVFWRMFDDKPRPPVDALQIFQWGVSYYS